MAGVDIYQELQWYDDFMFPNWVSINGESYHPISLDVAPPPSPAQPSTFFVFLGEGNFSFSRAFAEFRGSPYGIVATDKEIQEEQEIRANWPMRLQLEIGANELWHPLTAGLKNREAFLNWLNLGVNPAHLVLWFQCPWAMGYGHPQNQYDQELFLRDIMAAAKKVQNHGELLLIGLCVDPDLPDNNPDTPKWVTRYGNPKAVAVNNGYECLGADREFVGEMLQRGYQHRFNANNANNVMTQNDKFATLLLRRQKLKTTQDHVTSSAPTWNFYI